MYINSFDAFNFCRNIVTSANKQKVYYGTIKEDFSSQLPSFLQEDSKKKRAKSKDAKEGKKKDPNAPAFDRIPLPDWY